ncbi:major facilitator superfamily domain-containing protein [Mycena galericulata]|nr:major facilitator superfamily domain-containing protein [Mycena galericulata]
MQATPPPDESSPLLTDHLEAQRPPKKPVPVPRAQLAALCISRLADPICYTQLFPWINEFLILLHVTDDVSKIGFYSGLVESTFAVSQTLTSYHWAKLSDVVGRRPIILLGTAGLAVVTLLLGFCTSLSQIIVVRALAGFLAGNLAVYHAVLAEITDPSNEAIAYPLYSFTWPFGGTFGPLIGGSLSNLGTKYPKYFAYDFLLSYPYFMPNFVCSLLVMFGFVLSFLFLEETLPSKRRGGPFQPIDSVDFHLPPVGAMDLLSIPMMRALTASGFTLSFIGTAFDVVFVLFCYTPIQRGGLSFSVNKIGYALALNGGILAIFQLFCMPTLLSRYNAAKMYNTSIRFWPLTFLLIPFLNLIVRKGYDQESGLYSPSSSSLGAANGLVQLAMCVSRCFSPAFIRCVDNNLLGGYPIWVVVMLSVCLVGCISSQKMVTMDEKSCGTSIHRRF